MLFNKTEKQEKTYLRQVINSLKKTIENANASIQTQEQDLREHKDYLWENKAEIDAQEKRSVRESILNLLMVGENVIALRKRLSKMMDIPYFGRIDFQEKGTNNIQPIYIGVHTFYDQESKSNLIYDWRAPISGMYYDYELGEASYLSPSGEVKGDISLKRQYRIRKGIMEYMIESSLTVHDDVLQRELSSNGDEKMKNIVATIQREQNQVIRNEEAYVLIIQGVAGSGKTSIALHRIAYLLYTQKKELSSKDILIISPNKVFGDYISNVLPELGEETVPETSMEKLLAEILDDKYKFQTAYGQVNELLGKTPAGLTERIQYKSSFDFIHQLDKFILHVENTYFKAADVQINKYVPVPKEYIEEQYKRFHRYPIRQRLDIMADYIAENLLTLYGIMLTMAEKTNLKKEIRKMFGGNNDLQLYKEFFQWLGTPEMFKMRKNNTLEYSDLAPLAYLRIAFDGLKPYTKVKHLLIDEMQDYSPIQYKVMMKLFPCRKTILGDALQSVNPYGSSTADMIQRAMITGEIIKLNKSYRSSYEITNFARKIRPNDELEAVARHGEEPEIQQFKNEEEEIAEIKKRINGFRKSNYQSFGIVCKDETQAERLYEKLRQTDDNIAFLSSESSVFIRGIVITSAHMAKGLEFDEVVIPHVDAKNYESEIDCSMLYVGVTRAMHKLTLTHTGKLTELIK